MRRGDLARLVLAVVLVVLAESLIGERYGPLRPRLWYATMRTAQELAHAAGRVAILAELHYREAVE